VELLQDNQFCTTFMESMLDRIKDLKASKGGQILNCCSVQKNVFEVVLFWRSHFVNDKRIITENQTICNIFPSSSNVYVKLLDANIGRIKHAQYI